MNKNNFKILRTEKGLRQEDIAKLLNVSRQAYSYWETGERNPDVEVLIALADYYNVTIDYLVGRSQIKTNYAINKDLEPYINHCINGYYKYIRKD
ncbi:MAG: helix-turn-helix transcriptional regulator [Clostridium sp.]|jgi:transcriptional regulator with XRE-family HTH domain|nr:helix-turn-helix transcriptional regulator [Clostridium sp.]